MRTLSYYVMLQGHRCDSLREGESPKSHRLLNYKLHYLIIRQFLAWLLKGMRFLVFICEKEMPTEDNLSYME